ncbi:unnamed protein product, partial [Discosporangium mesarthrocarpum]
DDGLREPRQAFIAQRTFTGSRPGYVFKKGSLGVGYYIDRA